MSLPTLLLALTFNKKKLNSEEHTEINMNKHYTKTYHELYQYVYSLLVNLCLNILN